MKLQFWSVGKNHEPYVKEGVELFTKRISNYYPVEWNILPMPKHAAMLSEMDLTHVERDELLFVTTPEDAESQLIVRVYDVRDLLAMPWVEQPAASKPAGMAGGMGGGMFAVADSEQVPGGISGTGSNAVQPGGSANRGGMGGMGPPGRAPPQPPSGSDSLIEMITTIVQPDSWDDVGGPGGVDCYKGLLAVSQTDQVHKRIERFLDMLREAAGLEVTTGKVVR